MSGLTIIDHVGPSPKQWHMAMRGMRQSWESQHKSDNTFDPKWPDDGFILGPADLALALRLANLGADHGKYQRQLPVIVELRAPGYFFREFDTYRVGVEASDIVQNSTSMMHTAGREPFTAAMFACDDLDLASGEIVYQMVASLNLLRDQWIMAGKRKGPQIAEWRALQQALPYGILYTRTILLNYQVLRSMYHARKHHRLAEWRDLCAWMETLEYSDLITTEAR